MREMRLLLAELQAAGCAVLGEPDYEGRFGFSAQAEVMLPGVPPGYFQVMAFGPGAPCGLVTHQKAFTTSAK